MNYYPFGGFIVFFNNKRDNSLFPYESLDGNYITGNDLFNPYQLIYRIKVISLEKEKNIYIFIFSVRYTSSLVFVPAKCIYRNLLIRFIRFYRTKTKFHRSPLVRRIIVIVFTTKISFKSWFIRKEPYLYVETICTLSFSVLLKKKKKN